MNSLVLRRLAVPNIPEIEHRLRMAEARMIAAEGCANARAKALFLCGANEEISRAISLGMVPGGAA